MVAKPRSAEMHPGSGFRVQLDLPRLEPSLMEEFRRFATPDISDLLNRLYAVDPVVRCLTGRTPPTLRPGLHRQGVPRRQPDGPQVAGRGQAGRRGRGRRRAVDHERRARRPDLDQGQAPQDRRVRRRRPDPRPAGRSWSSTTPSSPAGRRRSARSTAARARSTTRSAAAAWW